MNPVLTLDRLTLRYGDTVAVHGLSLDVRPGEVFGLLGPNGSGKSTTIAAIVGAHPPASGTIHVDGRVEADAPYAYRRSIGLVPQELALYEDFSARHNVRFFGRLYGLTGRELAERTEEVLSFVRLSEQADRPARTFSGGMQRRLNLACALVHRPRLLLLDEPTVGIDIQSRDAIFASLRQLAESGSALVYTTHHLEEAELLCDRIGIMDAGRLLAIGTVEELCRRHEPVPPGWRLDGPHVCDSGVIGSLTRPARPLERVFLELTGRSLRES